MLAVGMEKKTVMQLWEGDWDMQLTKNAIEKKYNCELIRDDDYNGGGSYWLAYRDDEGYIADEWNLKEMADALESRQSKGA